MAECSSIVEERPVDRNMTPADRVIAMRDRIRQMFPREEDRPKFILCLLPERKASDLYGDFLSELQLYLLLMKMQIHSILSFCNICLLFPRALEENVLDDRRGESVYFTRHAENGQ